MPPHVQNEGLDPVLGTGLADRSNIVLWLVDRIAEIEQLTQALPPIAVLVTDEEEVVPLADALNEALGTGNIQAVPCVRGQLAGQDNDVRVFDVQHIKGLEFESVFFIAVDHLAEHKPNLFEKFLYVGATRAAMYLGMTTVGPTLPPKIIGLTDRFRHNWS